MPFLTPDYIHERACHDCTAPAVPGRSQCRKHLTSGRARAASHRAGNPQNKPLAAAAARTFRAHAKATGRCAGAPHCPRPVVAGQTLCQHHRDCQRRLSLKYRFGVSGADLERRVAETETCELCGLPFVVGDKNRSKVIDHDHQTGEIRGVLHGLCNIGLGAFADNPDLLILAAEYLRRNKEKVA